MGEDRKTHYRVILKCLNCGNQFERDIKLGMLVSEYIRKEKVTCYICECEDARIVGGVTV